MSATPAGDVIRPPLPPTILIVVAAWTIAGLVILGSSVLGWPPVSSIALEVPGWEPIVGALGSVIAVGGGLFLWSTRLRLDLSWRVETAGLWLLAAGWAAYAWLATTSDSTVVVIIMLGKVTAALFRVWEVHDEELVARAVPGAEGLRDDS